MKTPTRSPAALVEMLWAPTLAFLGATLVLWATLLASGQPLVHFLWGSTWVHWDAGLYESIAESGISLVRCAPGSASWCGNAGWFPGYPVLLAPFYSLGITHNGCAVAVSWVFDWGTLVLMWNGFLRAMAPGVRYTALVFVAAIPGGIFMRAAFPMAMTDFFLVGSFILARRDRLWWAGLSGAVASFCYLSAGAWAPVLGAWILLSPSAGSWPKRILRAAGPAALVAGGVVAAFVLMWAYTGHLNAYFLVQAKYQHGFHNPFTEWHGLIKPLFTGGTGVYAAQAAEGFLTTVYVAVLLITVGVSALKRTATGWDLAMLVLVLILWILPLTQSDLDYWRGDTLMIGGVLLWNRMRPTPAVLLASAAVGSFALLGLFYFQGTLS